MSIYTNQTPGLFQIRSSYEMNMKHQSKPTFVSFSVSFVLLFTYFSAFSPFFVKAAEDERDFYVDGGKKGTAQWGESKFEAAACMDGATISPIDLSDQRLVQKVSLGDLKINHKLSNASLKNAGPYIMLGLEGDAGSMEVNGIKYFLRQAHWHSPSMHLINGKRYDMELHMAYISPDPEVQHTYAAISVLYQIGHPDPFLSKLMEDIELLIEEKGERSVGVVDPGQINQLGAAGNKNYFRYVGALPTPPCVDRIIWTVSQQFGTVSKEQVNLIRAALQNFAELNARHHSNSIIGTSKHN